MNKKSCKTFYTSKFQSVYTKMFADDFAYAWRNMQQSNEQYVLEWESDHLKRLGKALDYIFEGILSMAATEALKFTVLSGKYFFLSKICKLITSFFIKKITLIKLSLKVFANEIAWLS